MSVAWPLRYGVMGGTVSKAGQQAPRLLVATVATVLVAMLAGCGGNAQPSEVGDNFATLGYRSACTDRGRAASRSAPAVITTVLAPSRVGIWPPVGDRLGNSPEVAANDFAMRLLGNPAPRLAVCSADDNVAVVRISPNESGPAAELTLRSIGETGWEVLASELEGASLSLAWPVPTERNRLELRGAGRLAGWTVEALDPATATVLTTTTAVAGSENLSWKADLVLATPHPPKVLFLLYRSTDSIAGGGRRSATGLALAYPVA